MKIVTRSIAFSAAALYLTSLWNKGFYVESSLSMFIISALVLALFQYLLRPLLKIVVLPLSLITFGLAEFALNIALFYVFSTLLGFVDIRGWTFLGYELSGLANLVLSSVSVSVIIGVLNKLL